MHAKEPAEARPLLLVLLARSLFHVPSSMLIYYLQSIARSLKLSSQQLMMQIQNVSII